MLEIDWVNWRIDKLIWVLPISNIFEQILIGLELMINVTQIDQLFLSRIDIANHFRSPKLWDIDDSSKLLEGLMHENCLNCDFWDSQDYYDYYGGAYLPIIQ